MTDCLITLYHISQHQCLSLGTVKDVGGHDLVSVFHVIITHDHTQVYTTPPTLKYSDCV